MTDLGSPFIPAWLDDMQLSPDAFRLLCHFWRRAGSPSRPCFSGRNDICATVGFSATNKRRLKKSVEELEARGLIRRERRDGTTNHWYVAFPPPTTPDAKTAPGAEVAPATKTASTEGPKRTPPEVPQQHREGGPKSPPKGSPVEGPPKEGSPERGIETSVEVIAPPSTPTAVVPRSRSALPGSLVCFQTRGLDDAAVAQALKTDLVEAAANREVTTDSMVYAFKTWVDGYNGHFEQDKVTFKNAVARFISFLTTRAEGKKLARDLVSLDPSEGFAPSPEKMAQRSAELAAKEESEARLERTLNWTWADVLNLTDDRGPIWNRFVARTGIERGGRLEEHKKLMLSAAGRISLSDIKKTMLSAINSRGSSAADLRALCRS